MGLDHSMKMNILQLHVIAFTCPLPIYLRQSPTADPHISPRKRFHSKIGSSQPHSSPLLSPIKLQQEIAYRLARLTHKYPGSMFLKHEQWTDICFRVEDVDIITVITKGFLDRDVKFIGFPFT